MEKHTVRLIETARHANIEGGFAFDDIGSVPKNVASEIYCDYLKLLRESKIVDVDSVVGLGSTRQILNNVPEAKPIAGDLDLLVMSNSSTDTVPVVTRALVKFFKSNDIKAKTFFGNIVSVSFPSDALDNKNAQIDLMVAIPSASNETYSYLRDLKFYSGETYDKSATLIIKGLHRTDLIRYLVKGVGLSMANQGFKAFKWNYKYEDVESLIADIDVKINRMRNEDSQKKSIEISKFFSNYTSIDKLKNLLADRETGFMRNRYQIAKHTGRPVDLVRDLAFDSVDMKDRRWTDVLSDTLNVPSETIQDRLGTFDGVLEVISDAFKRGVLSQSMLEHIFTGYKFELSVKKSTNFWSDELEQKIVEVFPKLKGRL